jgi:hypothetical protein
MVILVRCDIFWNRRILLLACVCDRSIVVIWFWIFKFLRGQFDFFGDTEGYESYIFPPSRKYPSLTNSTCPQKTVTRGLALHASELPWLSLIVSVLHDATYARFGDFERIYSTFLMSFRLRIFG